MITWFTMIVMGQLSGVSGAGKGVTDNWSLTEKCFSYFLDIDLKILYTII